MLSNVIDHNYPKFILVTFVLDGKTVLNASFINEISNENCHAVLHDTINFQECRT